jgi:hypothetical protein
MFTAMLIVAVLGVGGPKGTRPFPIVNANVTVSANGKAIGGSAVGNLALWLRPGTYIVRAALAGVPRPCQSRTVRLRYRRKVTLTLTCSVP